MTDIPHFGLPFRLAGGAAVVNEQDSSEDVVSCALAILLCPAGYRAELPEFGIDDPTFSEMDVDLDAIARALAAWEPRADALLSQSRDALDELVAYVSVAIATRSTD